MFYIEAIVHATVIFATNDSLAYGIPSHCDIFYAMIRSRLERREGMIYLRFIKYYRNNT